MHKKHWSALLFMFSFFNWFFPDWNGFLFEASDMSVGEGRIVVAVFLVGGLLLWYLPIKKSRKIHPNVKLARLLKGES